MSTDVHDYSKVPYIGIFSLLKNIRGCHLTHENNAQRKITAIKNYGLYMCACITSLCLTCSSYLGSWSYCRLSTRDCNTLRSPSSDSTVTTKANEYMIPTTFLGKCPMIAPYFVQTVTAYLSDVFHRSLS